MNDRPAPPPPPAPTTTAPAWSTSPSPPPPRPDLRGLRGIAVVVVAGAVLWDLALRSRVGGVAAFLAVAVTCVGLWCTGRVVRRGGRVLLCSAVGVAGFLALRSSPPLVVVDLVVVGVLMSLACTSEAGARPMHAHFSAVATRLVDAVGTLLTALPTMGRAAGSLGAGGAAATGRIAGSIARGLLLALPVVAVLGISLATADAVFASWMDVDLDAGGLLGHVLVLLAAASISTGWFLLATRAPVHRDPQRVTIGAVESLVVLVSLTCLYAVFAAAQLLVSRRGPDYVASTTGLTYAEYARSGFFQLIWVAGATAVVLLVLRSSTRSAGPVVDRMLRATGALACALTLVLVHTALVRLGLYEDEFGATLLRLVASTTAWWLGAVFLAVGVAFALGRGTREWLPTALGCITLVAVITLNVADPERRVVEHNVERAGQGERFDVRYALRLSPDAVPTLVEGIDALDRADATRLERELCRRHDVTPVQWTLSARRGAAALDELCS